jgi:DNA-binding beta-propeller fold protein YncE
MFNKKHYATGLLYAALMTFVVTACDPDEPTVPTPTTSGYENGILIINEGPFGSGSGTFTHYERSTKAITNDVFGLANNGAKVGNILQSYTLHQGKGYVLVNNANKVWVVDAKTFKFNDTIGGIKLPRFMQVLNDTKGYISNWATGVSVVDLSTKKVTKTIKVGGGAEKMLLDGTSLWVLNSGGIGKDSTISIIDTKTDVVSKTITAAYNPNSIVATNGSIWVLCSSYFDVKGKGKLIEYKNGIKANSYDIPQFATNLVVAKDGKTLYFLADNAIYQKGIADTDAPKAYITGPGTGKSFTYPYGLGIDPKDGAIYCADAKNFAVNSEVFVFDSTSKTLLQTIAAGIGTNGFYFGN